jgi:predicted enzyme related to lactoylglutathione lyase
MTPVPARPSVHLSIDVPDLAAGLDFYATVCGFRETARPFPTMAVVDGGNLSVCLHEKPAGSPSSGEGSPLRDYARHWTPVHMDIHVDDFEDTLLRIAAAGGVIERTFRNTGPRPVAFSADPFGNGFCVIGPRPAAEAGAQASSTPGSSA